MDIQDFWNDTSLLDRTLRAMKTPDEMDMFVYLLVKGARDAPRYWHDLNLGHIAPSHRLLAVSYLRAEQMSREIFDFLTLAHENPHSEPSTVLQPRPLGPLVRTTYSQINQDVLENLQDEEDLLEAFRLEVLAEAAQSDAPHLLGEFILTHIPLEYIDSMLKWETMRLSFSPETIRGSLICSDSGKPRYFPFYWSPLEHSFHAQGNAVATGLNMMLACIWRDARVLHKRFYTEQAQQALVPPPPPKIKKRRVLVLPRTIPVIGWSTPKERSHIIRTAHFVRAHYRRLLGSRQASDVAMALAKEHGYPPPPHGFTFVKPHQRGTGEPDPERMEVVCRGLQKAAISLAFQYVPSYD